MFFQNKLYKSIIKHYGVNFDWTIYRENPKSKIESFSDLFEKSFEKINNLEGSVVEGRVISVEKEAIIVDIGLKSEGRILKENLEVKKKQIN